MERIDALEEKVHGRRRRVDEDPSNPKLQNPKTLKPLTPKP